MRTRLAAMNRRDAILLLAFTGAAGASGTWEVEQSSERKLNSSNSSSFDDCLRHASSNQRTAMTITCFIRYRIDPYQRDGFKKYAENWGRIIPRCGGHLVGYFLPHEGTNDVAWGLISFPSLASYEAYRARLRSDKEAIANFAMAQTKRLILREERTFLELVDGTFSVLAQST